MTNTPTIEIPRSWIERLVKLSNQVEQAKDAGEEQDEMNYLLGYLQSAEALLK